MANASEHKTRQEGAGKKETNFKSELACGCALAPSSQSSHPPLLLVSLPSTPLGLRELNLTDADDASLTDTQRRIARRRVLEARARATMTELDALTKSFQHLASPRSPSVEASTPLKPAATASATASATTSATASANSSTAVTPGTPAALRVRDVLLLSRNAALLLGTKHPLWSI
jgi:hypothetical protein